MGGGSTTQSLRPASLARGLVQRKFLELSLIIIHHARGEDLQRLTNAHKGLQKLRGRGGIFCGQKNTNKQLN